MNECHELSVATIDTANQLHHSALRLFRLLMADRTSKGLSPAKLSVLGLLYREGAATATALAAYLRVQPQSLTRLIADLERQGLISRRPDEEDHRRNLLEITDAGAGLLTEEIRGQRVNLAQTMARELTVPEQELLRIAATLMDRLAESTEAQITSSGMRN